MIPGEIFPAEGILILNEGAVSEILMVANEGDRPIQVGEAYLALKFDREKARGMRLDIVAGTAIRFEPGQRREVQLIPILGKRCIYGFNQKIMGDL